MRYCNAQYYIYRAMEKVKELLEDADYSNDTESLKRELTEAMYMSDKIEGLLEWLEDMGYIPNEM